MNGKPASYISAVSQTPLAGPRGPSNFPTWLVNPTTFRTKVETTSGMLIDRRGEYSLEATVPAAIRGERSPLWNAWLTLNMFFLQNPQHARVEMPLVESALRNEGLIQ